MTASSQVTPMATKLPAAVMTSRNQDRIAYAVFFACLISLLALHVSFMRANGTTLDEFTHLQAGYRYWQCGEFANNPEHPPLIKLVAALPIRGWQLGSYPTPCGQKAIEPPEGPEIAFKLSRSPHSAEMLWKARFALLVFPVLLLTSVFFATRRWFGNLAAGIAAVLITIEPTLVAHGSLVTSDAALTAFAFITIWLGIEFVRRPSWWRFAGTALALGLALASKHSAVVLPFLLLFSILLSNRFREGAPGHPFRSLLVWWMCMSALALAVLWASYGFRYAALPHASQAAYPLAQWFADGGMAGSPASRLILFLAQHHLLPEAYLAGLSDVVISGSRLAYIFGRIHPAGVWYYFPVALAIKTTVGVLGLFLLTLFSRRFWTSHKETVAPLLLFIALFLGIAMAGKMNIGVRHVLPVVPFLIVVAAGGASRLTQGARSRIAVCVLIAASVISGVRAAPAQLSYANELFGGPAKLHYFLSDSNLDWGQSAKELQSYLTAHASSGTSKCAVVPSIPLLEKTSCMELPTIFDGVINNRMDPSLPDKFEGTVVLQPLVTAWTSAYLPLLNREPEEVEAHGTILVYHGTFDFREIAALRRFHRGSYLMQVAGKSWPSPESRATAVRAGEEFAAAEANCPETNRVDLEIAYMASLTAQERWTEARYHAEEVLRLTANAPTYRRQRQFVLNALNAGNK